MVRSLPLVACFAAFLCDGSAEWQVWLGCRECPQGCIKLRTMYLPKVWLESPGIKQNVVTKLEPLPKQQFPKYGRLKLRIIEARGLPTLRTLHQTNPFAVVQYAGKYDKTQTVLQSTKPHWNAMFEFHVFDLGREVTIGA